MCAVKAIAPVGDRAFLEAFLKYGCNAKQIGCMTTAYEEFCLFPDDGLQQQSQSAMQETVVSHAILPLATSLLVLVSVTEHLAMLRFVFFDSSFSFSCSFVDVQDAGLDKVERCMCA